jgi:uncharacterized protein (DUF58 family)
MWRVTSILPIIAVLLLIAAFLRVGFIFHALYILLGAYLLTAIWSSRAARGLRVTRRFEPRALHGDDVAVALEIRNTSIWPIPWLRVFEHLPVDLATPPFHAEVVSLLPRECVTVRYTLRCRRRGYYPIGPLEATAGDVFGLRSVQRNFAVPEHLIVYPRVLPLEELGLPSRAPFGHLRTQHPLYEDPARVSGVRDYQSGDSLRKMNWRATAAAGRLQVRKLEPAMTLQTIILLNLNTDEYEPASAVYASELAIVAAASLANRLVELRQEVGLVTNGRDPLDDSTEGASGLAARKGRAQLTAVLETLGRIEAMAGAPFAQLLRSQMTRLPWGATLVAVTSRESDELWETLLVLRRAGYVIAIVFCDYPSPHAFDAAQARAAGLGFVSHRVWKETDLDSWRQHGTVGR